MERSSSGGGDDVAVTGGELEQELARLDAGDPFTALRLSYDADDRAVRVAFLAATKRLHPNRFARAAPPVRALANEVFLRVKDAYHAIERGDGRARVLARLGRVPAAPITVGEGSGAVRAAFPGVPRVVLTPPGGSRPGDVPRQAPAPAETGAPSPPPAPSARAPSPAPAPPPRASNGPTAADLRKLALQRRDEEAFAAAVRTLEQGHAEPARRELQRLAAADPGERKYQLWLHQATGREHQAAGRLAEARAEYRRALDLDPSFAPALAALASLEPDGDRPPAGLSPRLFRK